MVQLRKLLLLPLDDLLLLPLDDLLVVTRDFNNSAGTMPIIFLPSNNCEHTLCIEGYK